MLTEKNKDAVKIVLLLKQMRILTLPPKNDTVQGINHKYCPEQNVNGDHLINYYIGDNAFSSAKAKKKPHRNMRDQIEQTDRIAGFFENDFLPAEKPKSPIKTAKLGSEEEALHKRLQNTCNRLEQFKELGTQLPTPAKQPENLPKTLPKTLPEISPRTQQFTPQSAAGKNTSKHSAGIVQLPFIKKTEKPAGSPKKNNSVKNGFRCC